MRRDILGLSFLFGAMYFIQGIGEPTTGLVTQPTFSLLKEWGNDATQIGLFTALLGLPWCLKPLCGLLTDFVPLAGYRRKSYLVVSGMVVAACFTILYFVPLSAGSHNLFLLALLPSALALTVSDVVLDALLIETGQAYSMTGRLQAICAGAGYAATVLTGSWGGRLTEGHQQQLSFLLCGLLTTVALVLSVVYVREPKQATAVPSFRHSHRELWRALRSPAVLVVAGFLFFWHFNPFSQPVLYLHMTGSLEIGEEAYGDTVSLSAIGSIAACAAYVFYCRRVPMRLLVSLAIAGGVASTLIYLPLADDETVSALSFFAGFSYMTSMMVLLDLAARACPVKVAGTIFALFMALCNISAGLSTWLGAYFYTWASHQWDSETAFSLVLYGSALCTLGSWLVARYLPAELLGHEQPQAALDPVLKPVLEPAVERASGYVAL